MAARIAKGTQETGAQTRPYLHAWMWLRSLIFEQGKDIPWMWQSFSFALGSDLPKLNKCASVRSLLSSNSCQERTWLKDIMLTANGC